MSNDLMIPEVTKPQEVFVEGGADVFIKAIDTIIDSWDFDLSTAKGIKEVKSNVYSLRRSKSYFDGVGKDYVSQIKNQAKVVDDVRKKFRDAIDERIEKIMKPVNEIEEAERKRIEALEDRVSEFERLSFSEHSPEGITSDELKANLDKVKAIKPDESFEEYQPRAAEVKLKAIERLEGLVAIAEKNEAQQAELERLREEKRQAEIKAREEAIREEERLEAERKAKAEKEAHEKALKEAEARAEAAKKQAKLDAERAAQAERERAEAQRQAEEDAKRKREEDQKHRKKINNEALKAFVDGGIDEETAKQVIRLIACREIPHVQINY